METETISLQINIFSENRYTHLKLKFETRPKRQEKDYLMLEIFCLIKAGLGIMTRDFGLQLILRWWHNNFLHI